MENYPAKGSTAKFATDRANRAGLAGLLARAMDYLGLGADCASGRAAPRDARVREATTTEPSGHAAAGLKPFGNLGQHADNGLAGQHHLAVTGLDRGRHG